MKSIDSESAKVFPHKGARVGAVMLTWNQREMTLEGLTSLSGLDEPRPRVILVDNGSHDGTIEAVHEKFPDVEILGLPENIGFCAANNRGAELLMQDSEIEYLVFLNNDIEIEKNAISLLTAFMDSTPGASACGPLIFFHEPPEIIWAAGGAIAADLMWFPPHLRGRRDPGLHRPRQVDYIHGCSLFVRRTVAERVGLFDERFFIYHDEVDWCLRMKKLGGEIWLVPDAHLFHKVSLAVGQHSPMMIYYTSRNKLLFWWKHGRWSDLPKFYAFHLWKLIRIFARVRNGWAYLSLGKALIDAFSGLFGRGHLDRARKG
ncbi:MAG: glycosyltransferase family 2 protein [Candidatus Riflebacteria bacterium]|nr:glycosyltransferase family 2 protein [Candidatus Riflebacteria bacterium]